MPLLRFLILILLTSSCAMAADGKDDALVTVAEGKIVRGGDADQPVPAFSRLKEGETVKLSKGAKLRVVYFASGRQETWEGPGKLEVGSSAGKSADLHNGGVVQLPEVLVRQIAKTPVEGGQGRAGMTRLRAIVSPDAISKVENTYRELRATSDAEDLNPEMYVLSAWLEMRAFSRVEQAIGDLRAQRPNDTRAMQLADIYEQTLRANRDTAR